MDMDIEEIFIDDNNQNSLTQKEDKKIKPTPSRTTSQEQTNNS